MSRFRRHWLIQGGGAVRGGKRENCGRKKDLQSIVWKTYRAPGKRERMQIAKNNMKVDDLFKKKIRTIKEDNIESVQINAESLDSILAHYKYLLKKDKLPFFLNGCKADISEKVSVDNFTCAVDSLYAIGEAVLLSYNEKEVNAKVETSPLLIEISKVLKWRLKNDFSWNHSLRNPLWNMIASSHPYAFEPLGKITASGEPAIIDLANLWPTTVVADIVCSNSGCKKHKS